MAGVPFPLLFTIIWGGRYWQCSGSFVHVESIRFGTRNHRPSEIVPSNRNSLASGSVPQCKIGTWKTCRVHALYFKTMYIYLEPKIDPCFDWKKTSFGGLS